MGFIKKHWWKALLVAILISAGFLITKILGTNSEKSTDQPAATNKQASSSTTTKKNTCSIAGGTVEVAWESADNAFTAAITNINAIAVISSGKLVGDQRFTYLQIKDRKRIPVYAPADGTLIIISYKNRADLPTSMSMPDYDLTFLVDCRTMYRINHITDPAPEIASLKPNTEPLQIGKSYPDPSEKDTQPKSNIMVKAGQQIGTTTGTPAAHNWDFGIFVDQEATCPYEKFNEPIRSAWLALLGDATKPIPGTACDVSGKF